ECQRAVRIGDQVNHRVGGDVPGDGVGREPVRLRLRQVAMDTAHDDFQVLVDRVPLEYDVHAGGRHGERDVRAVLRAAGAVVHVPTTVEGDLGLVRAGRNGIGAEAVGAAALDVFEPGTKAARIPIAGAANLALEAAGHRGNDGADVLSDPMGFVVVVERDVLRGTCRAQRNVLAVLLRVQAVIDVPGAVERDFVLVAPSRIDAESVLPDVAVGVVDELGGPAGRIPIAAAAGLALVIAGDADGGGRLGRGRIGVREQECESERHVHASAQGLRRHIYLPIV